jgi:hypothetical protein
MKKLLILIFALVAILGFGQNTDWSKYWTSELKKPITNAIQELDPTFDTTIIANEKTSTIIVTIIKVKLDKSEPNYIFTKYENIFYSSVIYDGLSNYYKIIGAKNKIKNWQILYVVTPPYERKIFIKDLDKLILSNNTKNFKNNNQQFISNSILINTEEPNVQQKK